MNYLFAKQISWIAIASITLTMASSAGAQNVRRITTFATGTAVNATEPDSVALSRNSVWVSYTNGADSTGLSGSSTIVQYKLNGEVRHTYSIAGSGMVTILSPKPAISGRFFAIAALTDGSDSEAS